ncbi:MAG: AsmA family protein [Alphaproteobacteria bacterium]|nr:AsmA family protein [Alphaproteobacteria bacterium]
MRRRGAVCAVVAFDAGGEKVLRSIWSYAGLALALIVAAILIVPGFLDWSRYAGLIEAQAEAVTGRDVTISGDVRISLLPTPKLTLGRMTIANAPGATAPHMAEIESMTAELSVGSLFRGDLNISRLSMKQPMLWLEETPEGRGNWLFQNGHSENNEGEATVTESEPDSPVRDALDVLPPLTIGEIEIEEGQIGLRNLGIGTDVEITSINALVGASSLNGPYKAKGTGVFVGEPADFLATLGEVSSEKAYPANVSLTFKDAEAAFSGIVTGLGADIRFDGAVSANAAAGLAPSLGALTAGQPVALSAGVVATPGGITLREIEAEAGAVSLTGEFVATAGPSFTVETDAVLNRLDFTGFDTAGLPLTMTSVANAIQTTIEQAPAGAYRLMVEDVRLPSNRLSNLELSAEAGGDTISVKSLSVQLPGDAEANAEGALSIGGEGAYFSGDVSIRGNKTSELVSWLNEGSVPHIFSEQPLEKVAAKASVFLTPARVSLDKLFIDLDGGLISGQLATSFEERPQVEVALDIEKIALPTDNLPVVGKIVPGRPVDLGFDGNVAFNVAALDAGPVHLESVSLKLEANDTDVTVSELLFKSAQGASATLSGQSSATQGQYQATLTAPSVASLDGLLPLPKASLDSLSSLSMSAQAQWPDEAALGDAANSRLETVGFSVLGRAGDVRVETEGQFSPGQNGNLDAAYSVTTTFGADQWQKLVRVGAAFMALSGDTAEQAEAGGQDQLPKSAADTPQTVTAVVEGTVGTPAIVAIQASTAGMTGTVAGQVDFGQSPTRFDLDVAFDTPIAQAVAQAAGHYLGDISSIDITGGLAFDGSGYDIGATSVRIEGADGAFDADINGRLAPAEERPAGSLVVTSRETDLLLLSRLIDGTYFRVPETSDEAEADSDSYWSAGLLDTSWLNLADIDFSVSGGGISFGPLVADQLVVSGQIVDQELSFSDLRASVFGGEVRGELNVKADAGIALDMTVAATNLDAGLTSEALGFGTVGTGAAAFDLTATGNGLSALALVSSLKGEGSFQVDSGTLSGLDLAALSDGLQQLEDSQDFASLADATLTSGATPYSSIAGKIAMTAGVLRAPDIDVKVDMATVKTAAYADIGRAALDTETTFTLDAPEGAPAATIVFAGDFSDPERTVNTVDLEAFAGRQLLQKEIDAIGGGESSELQVILDLAEDQEAESATP